MVYVRNDIRYEIILTRNIESKYWNSTIEVKEKLYEGIVIAVYH